MKSPEAAKAMATKNGAPGSCVICDNESAMGNMMETAAAFVIKAVNRVVTINRTEINATGGNVSTGFSNMAAIHPAAPDFTSATPIANEQTSTANRFRSNCLRISLRFNTRPAINNSSADREAVNKVITLVIPRINKARLARPKPDNHQGFVFKTRTGFEIKKRFLSLKFLRESSPASNNRKSPPDNMISPTLPETLLPLRCKATILAL